MTPEHIQQKSEAGALEIRQMLLLFKVLGEACPSLDKKAITWESQGFGEIYFMRSYSASALAAH